MKHLDRRSYRLGSYSVLLGAALFLATCLPASATVIVTSQTQYVAPTILALGGWVAELPFTSGTSYNPGPGYTLSGWNAGFTTSATGSASMLGLAGKTLSTNIINELQFSSGPIPSIIVPTYTFSTPASCTASGFILGGCTASVSWNDGSPFSNSLDNTLGISSSPFTLFVEDLAYTSNAALLGLNSKGGVSVHVNYIWTSNSEPGGPGTGPSVPAPPGWLVMLTGLGILVPLYRRHVKAQRKSANVLAV